MPRPVPPASAEYACGMEVFYTDTPPIGGKLRTVPEDFVVEELGGAPRDDPNGKHLACQVRLVNWEHNHFIRDAARMLGVSRQAFGFAGTKDKRAVTTQWFTVNARLSDREIVDRLHRLPRVDVLAHHRTTKALHLGDHDGNRFVITIRGLDRDADAVGGDLNATVDQLASLGGFPNFFGIQRFGSVRPVTHLVGRDIVHGRIEDALVRYITAPASDETEGVARARAHIVERRDWKSAQRALPVGLKFELAIVQQLSRDPQDFAKALRQLPNNLVVLFVHSYQSYLYNRMLSLRIRSGLPLARAVEGDIVQPMHKGQVIESWDPVRVTAANVDRVNDEMAKGRAGVTLPLVGLKTELAAGTPGEIERRILDEEEMAPERFLNQAIPEASSSGTRRVLLTSLADLTAEVEAENASALARIGFSLPKGAYATTLLREVMKADEATRY